MAGVLIPSTNGFGTSLLEVRQYTAKELGPFETTTATGASDVGNWIDTSWPINSTNDQASLYTDFIHFRPNASLPSDMSRIVKLYTPSGGILSPDLNWAAAPSAGEAGELHGRIDPLKLHGFINEALKELMVVAEITMTPIANATRYNVTSVAPWMRNEKWIRQVGFLKTTDNRDEIDPYAFRIVRGAAERLNGQVYIKHPYVAFEPSTDTIYIKCLVPAYYLCRSSSTGTWGERSGLASDTHEAPVSVDWLASAALVLAWRRYSQILEPGANGRLINDLQTAVAWKSELTDRDLETPELTFRDMPQRWGPLQHGGVGWFDF